MSSYSMTYQRSAMHRLVLSTALLCLFLMRASSGQARELRSEYVVFAGKDKAGKVVFAVNTAWMGSRERARRKAYMYVQGKGWVRLKGNGVVNKVLGQEVVGDGSTEHFKFGKDEKHVLTVKSDVNGLFLRVNELNSMFAEGKQGRGIEATCGTASLYFNGRLIKGQAYRLYRNIVGVKRDKIIAETFQGARIENLYMNIPRLGTFHLYRHNNELFANYDGHRGCLLRTDSLRGRVDQFEFNATRWQKMGLYNLPFEWQGSFVLDGEEVLFKVTSKDLKNYQNVFLSGQRMGLAEGFIHLNGETHTMYGLSEVTHFMEGEKMIKEDEKANEPPAPINGNSWRAAVHGPVGGGR